LFVSVIRAVLAVAVVLPALPGAVSAQTAEQDSVQERARPDFDPIGIELDELLGVVGLVSAKTIEQKSSPLSSFVVKPSFGVTGVYDSNIFLTENNEVGDKRVEYRPQVAIQSDWGRHAFGITAFGVLGRYVENTDEDFNDYQIQTSGRLDIYDNKKLELLAGVAQRHEERDEEDDPGRGFKPTVSFNKFAKLTFEYLADVFLTRFIFDIEHQDFKNSDGINNDARDETIIETSLRLGYEFTPGTTVFVEPNADFRLFDQERDGAGNLQDNWAVGSLVGMTFDVTGVTFLEFGVGFEYRSFDDPSFGSEFNFDFLVRHIWNVTDVISLTTDIERTFEDSATPGVSGVIEYSLSTVVDYELLDNVIVSSGVGLSFSETSGTGREDLNINPTLAVKYLVNENWTAQLNLGYATRESTAAGESFENYSASFGLVMKL
tara:strand:+ start:2812 stop:4113 length:1302 start_codon:yes stop_codon:yes gene_type:complete